MAERQEHHSQEAPAEHTGDTRTLRERPETILISPYLTLTEAAAYARCSTRTIQRYVDAGELTRYGHSRRLLIKQEELERHLSPATPKGRASS